MLNCKCVKKCFDELVVGNKNFVSDPVYKNQRKELATKEKNPCTVVLSCSDSRISAPIIFGDTTLGTFFEVETAGQTIEADDIETIKYALMKFHVKLIVVIGHTDCSAIKTTIDSLTDSKLKSQFPNIIRDIIPSVQQAMIHLKINITDLTDEKNKKKLLNLSIIQNAIDKAQSIAFLLNLKYGQHVRAGVYNTHSGYVTWYDENCQKIIHEYLQKDKT